MRPRSRAPSVGDIDEGGSTSCEAEWTGGGRKVLGGHEGQGGRGFIFSNLFFSDLRWQVRVDTENTTKAWGLRNARDRRNSVSPSPINNTIEFWISLQYLQKLAKSFSLVGVSEGEECRGRNSKCA